MIFVFRCVPQFSIPNGSNLLFHNFFISLSILYSLRFQIEGTFVRCANLYYIYIYTYTQPLRSLVMANVYGNSSKSWSIITAISVTHSKFKWIRSYETYCKFRKTIIIIRKLQITHFQWWHLPDSPLKLLILVMCSLFHFVIIFLSSFRSVLFFLFIFFFHLISLPHFIFITDHYYCLKYDFLKYADGNNNGWVKTFFMYAHKSYFECVRRFDLS